MSIVLRKDAPTDGPEAIAEGLGDLELFPTTEGLLGGAPLDVSQPIAAYRVELKDILSREAPLDAAIFVGWRYLVEQPGVGEASYVDVSPDGDRSRFVSVSKNLNAERLLAAAHLGERLASSAGDEFEFRTLDVPSVKLSALWLHSRKSIFIPYIDGFFGGDLVLHPIPSPAFNAELVRRGALAQKNDPNEDPPRFRER